MDMVTLIEQLIVMVLGSSSLPGWIVSIILSAVKSYLTPAMVAAIEKEVKCYVCAQVKAVAKNSPSTIDDQMADVFCKALGGDSDCK